MTHMSEQIIEESAVRLEKLNQIIADGVNPYPSVTERSHTIAEVLGDFDHIAETAEKVTIVGRVKSVRGHGGACFSDIEDGTQKIQLHVKKDLLGDETFDFFVKQIDHGDFVQVTGTAFVTKRGQNSICITEIKLLAKALRPLPAKWHGLSDVEIRYRKRYLDLIANPSVRTIFRKRSMLVQAIREFFHGEGFMEVETPILQPLAGGATARPFMTHHNALDIDLYLRIAPELYLKRLIVGGYERVFEIARCFRNEGIDHLHNPEFTQIEFYQAYADYNVLMILTERLLPYLAKQVNGVTTVEYEGKTIDFEPPYPRITFRDSLIQYGDIDLDLYEDRASLAKAAEGRGVKVEASEGRGAIMDNLFKKLVRPKIVNPTFVVDHPIELSPLAKKKYGNDKYVERFQLLLAEGTELINAFSELNDAMDQKERFQEQEQLREGGDDEAQRYDADFIEALEVGMPPTAGFGMGIDRMSLLLTGTHSLKEVILFPTMRPCDDMNEDDISE